MYYRTKRHVRFIFATTLLLTAGHATAELLLNESPSVSAMQNILSGPGLKIENLRLIKGVKGQYGIFSDTSSADGEAVINLPDGIYLTTGSSDTILGPNDNDKYTYNTRIQYADSDLTGIAENAIFDPAIIEFDIIPEGDQVNFVLVFGSEEYPEYVCSKFNDVFGLFISGPGIAGTQNAAFLPGSNDPIAVNNINSGSKGSVADGAACNLYNSMYFVDNGNGTGARGTQLDGFSHPLTASLDGLWPGQRYRVKLALADTGDQAYDSAAFFKWLTSTSSRSVDLELTAQTATHKPAKDSLIDIVYTVTNTSSHATRLVEVGIELPAGVVFLSDDSNGEYDSLEGHWQVGDLAANSSKSITIRASIGSAQRYQLGGEIQYAFNEDPDSTPYNRLSNPGEDDTVLLKLYPTENHPPLITHDNSAASSTLTVKENTTGIILDLDAEDADGETETSGLSWMIAGGADAQHFTLSAAGHLSLTQVPDYERAYDHDTNNDYEVVVKVCDSHASCDQQSLTVIITDDPDETVATPHIQIRLQAMLQGPYDPSSGLMRDGLRSKGYLPKKQPYSSLQSSPGHSSRGNTPLFNYEGDEELEPALLSVTGKDAIVDWLLVEVRDSDAPRTVLAAAAVLVQRDGDLVRADTGEQNLIISGVEPGSHHIAVRHRNHLSIMTATPVPLSDETVYEYDFTATAQAVYGKNSRVSMPQHQLMWAGDSNSSNTIVAMGPGRDTGPLLGSVLVAPENTGVNANYPLAGYHASDLNMDGLTIYSGPRNDLMQLLSNIFSHPDNTHNQANFIIQGSLP